jgi:hypothetical protein
VNARLIGYLLLPARPAGLLFIGILAIGFALCSLAGLLGVPMLLVLSACLFTYGYVLLEHVAHGAREPPVLAIEMLNQATEHRPLLQFAILGLGWLALRSVAPRLGAVPTAALEALALAALPASVAVLALDRAFWRAADPLALWQVARALGASYLAIVALALLYGFGLAALSRYAPLPSWLLHTIAIYAWLSLFAFIGGALFEHRDDLGLEAMYAPERLALRAQAQVERDRDRFLDGVFAQARSGNLRGAWQSIERVLEALGHENDCYEWLHARLAQHEDQRLASRLAQEYIHRLLGRDNGRIVELVRERLRQDAQFHPRTEAETLRVADLLRLAGDRAGAEALQASFAREAAGPSQAPL